MADRRSLGSGMKEELSQISGFGSEGDWIVSGTGYRAGAENTSMAGGTTLVDLPGYSGLKGFANIRYGGQSFTFSDLSVGKAYFAYDKAYAEAEHQLALYVNEEKHSDLMLPGQHGILTGTMPITRSCMPIQASRSRRGFAEVCLRACRG